MVHDNCIGDVNQRKEFVKLFKKYPLMITILSTFVPALILWDITMSTDGKKTDSKISRQRAKGKEIVNKDFRETLINSSFPRKPESKALNLMDSRFRGNDER
jgi:hypothetical protein